VLKRSARHCIPNQYTFSAKHTTARVAYWGGQRARISAIIGSIPAMGRKGKA
tara:strand:+ start:401 stop:556 length:156 start_codon:yes stop_codon:yes gene_type:complete